MQCLFKIDDVIAVDHHYVNKTLAKIPSPTILQTLERLGHLEPEGNRVLAQGEIEGHDPSPHKYYIVLLPTNPSNPAFQGGKGVVLYFLSMDQLNGSFTSITTSLTYEPKAFRVFNDTPRRIPAHHLVKCVGYSQVIEAHLIEPAELYQDLPADHVGITMGYIPRGLFGTITLID